MVARFVLGAWLLALLSSFAGGRDFNPQLYTFDEFNNLRRSQPLDRMKIYQKAVSRSVTQIQRSVTMRNYAEMERELEILDKRLDDVLIDVRTCLEEPRNRKKSQLRKFEISLRECVTEVSGAQKALPLVWREKPDAVIKKLFYGRRLIFNFINSQDDSE